MAKSTGDPVKGKKDSQVSIGGAVTKNSVQNHIESALGKKYPGAVFPESTLKEYTSLLLASGLRQDAMDKIMQMESKRQGQ